MTSSRIQSFSTIPLVVDLDGTLTPTDTLMESLLQFVKRSPLNVLRLLFWLALGRAELKERLASEVRLNVESLPYRSGLLDYLRNEKASGRRLILATAAHRSIAEAVSAHLGLFDLVLATERQNNLKGRNKLAAIRERIGEDFCYAGDSRADLPVWLAARGAIVVGASESLARRVASHVQLERRFDAERRGVSVWARAVRLHQWLKNMLLFVPLLTAFSFLDTERLSATILAFFAFSITASATYIANDLWDLDNDRAHPRKKFRPFASGLVSIPCALAVMAIGLVAGFALAASVSTTFAGLLLVYLSLTTAYSWALKEYVLLDVLMLSMLYTLRIVAGTVVADLTISSWLLAFSVFTFLSLALVKRCAELRSLEQTGRESARGRDYRVQDLVVLWPLGVGAALAASVVFGMFISAPETQARYASPQVLWLAAFGLVYWLGRLWIKTSRGEMHDDPLVYALRDSGSRMTVLSMIAIVLLAHGVDFGFSL